MDSYASDVSSNEQFPQYDTLITAIDVALADGTHGITALPVGAQIWGSTDQAPDNPHWYWRVVDASGNPISPDIGSGYPIDVLLSADHILLNQWGGHGVITVTPSAHP